MHTENSNPFERKIVTRGYKKNFVDHDSIVYITSEDKLSTIFLEDGDKIPIIKSLDAFEELLSSDGFFRIRNNTIINGKFLTEADTRIQKRTVKIGEIDLIVAKDRLKAFKKWISK
jgi:DNA-binding LytR/AlgR family response regulator